MRAAAPSRGSARTHQIGSQSPLWPLIRGSRRNHVDRLGDRRGLASGSPSRPRCTPPPRGSRRSPAPHDRSPRPEPTKPPRRAAHKFCARRFAQRLDDCTTTPLSRSPARARQLPTRFVARARRRHLVAGTMPRLVDSSAAGIIVLWNQSPSSPSCTPIPKAFARRAGSDRCSPSNGLLMYRPATPPPVASGPGSSAASSWPPRLLTTARPWPP